MDSSPPPPPSAAAAAAAASTPPASELAHDDADYEARRQAQITRNQQLLTQLTGVVASTSLTREQAAAMAEARAHSAQQAKAARARARAERLERMALLPRRDLPHRRARGDVNYAEEAVAERAASSKASGSTEAAATNGDADDGADTTPRVNASLSDFVVPDRAPLGRVATGRPSTLVPTLPLSQLAPYIGRSIPLLYHTPKASAMSFLVAGWPSESNRASHRAPPTFNKMSGIQRLANHVAIVINIDEVGGQPLGPSLTGSNKGASGKGATNGSSIGGYGNQWSDGGRRITWYAQPTQRVDTPVIGQIIAAVRAKQAMMDGSAEREAEAYAKAVLGAATAGNSAASSAAAASSTAAASTPAPAAAAAAASTSKRASSKRKATAASPDLPSVKLEPTDAEMNGTAAAAAAVASTPAAASAKGAAKGMDVDMDAAAAAPAVPFDPPSVLLFIRHIGGPYVYCGPLAYHAHDTTRQPMQFVFTLAEFDKLERQRDFRKMLPFLEEKEVGEEGEAEDSDAKGKKSKA